MRHAANSHYRHSLGKYKEYTEDIGSPSSFNFSLYGTRGAASNWEDHYSKVLMSIGFRRRLSSPCLLFHESRYIQTVVHGDDFTSLGTHEQLLWLASELKKHLSIKERGILGPGPNTLCPRHNILALGSFFLAMAILF